MEDEPLRLPVMRDTLLAIPRSLAQGAIVVDPSVDGIEVTQMGPRRSPGISTAIRRINGLRVLVVGPLSATARDKDRALTFTTVKMGVDAAATMPVAVDVYRGMWTLMGAFRTPKVPAQPLRLHAIRGINGSLGGANVQLNRTLLQVDGASASLRLQDVSHAPSSFPSLVTADHGASATLQFGPGAERQRALQVIHSGNDDVLIEGTRYWQVRGRVENPHHSALVWTYKYGVFTMPNMTALGAGLARVRRTPADPWADKPSERFQLAVGGADDLRISGGIRFGSVVVDPNVDSVSVEFVYNNGDDIVANLASDFVIQSSHEHVVAPGRPMFADIRVSPHVASTMRLHLKVQNGTWDLHGATLENNVLGQPLTLKSAWLLNARVTGSNVQFDGSAMNLAGPSASIEVKAACYPDPCGMSVMTITDGAFAAVDFQPGFHQQKNLRVSIRDGLRAAITGTGYWLITPRTAEAATTMGRDPTAPVYPGPEVAVLIMPKAPEIGLD